MSGPVTAPRRVPCQQRGRRRVHALLAAAAEVFAEVGYDAATMSAIAERADASIGSLYQFFPNKQAVARALRAHYGEEYECIWASLHADAPGYTTAQLVDGLVDALIDFVRGHPAYLALVDAPADTRMPGVQARNRQQIARLLRAHRPGLTPRHADRAAAVMQQVNKGMTRLYAEADSASRRWIVEEFKRLLIAYLSARLRP
jgi:AcrR family transcriptional regulator